MKWKFEIFAARGADCSYPEGTHAVRFKRLPRRIAELPPPDHSDPAELLRGRGIGAVGGCWVNCCLLELRTVLRKDQGIHRKLLCLAPYLQLESIREQPLDHQSNLTYILIGRKLLQSFD